MANRTVFQMHNYDFGLKLTRNLVSTGQEANLIFSPASITLVLAMCYFGANGETRREMKDKIFGDQTTRTTDDDVKHWSHSLLQLALTSNAQFKLKFANRLYANKNSPLKDKYVRLIAAFFNSAALQANFETQSDQITDEINNWVAEVTDQKIMNLIPSEMLGPSTALVLINALYFNGVWEDKFFAGNTKKQNFHTTADQTIEIDMMHLTKRKHWFEDEDAQILKLDYIRSTVSMILVLPKQRNGLKSLIGKLNSEKLMQWFDVMEPKKVIMEIPKFKIEQAFKLNDALKILGVNKAFAPGADFSAMVDQSNLYISDVYHKSFIKVDENGTEAAAATFVRAMAMSGIIAPPEEPKQFIADHPFLFFLTTEDYREYKTTILFIGQFYGKDAATP